MSGEPSADAGGETDAARGILDALRDNPQWRRLYVARTASLFGNWFNTLAIVHLLGGEGKGGALALALVFILKQLPAALLGPLAGVIADRLDRRRIMIVCDLLDAGLALSFLFLAAGGPRWPIYALAAGQIAVATVFDPARQAVVPSVVQRRDLVAANALGSVTWSAMFALGTALGGIVLATLGWRWAIGIDAASYLLSAVLIATMRIPRRVRERANERPSWSRLLGVDDFVEGLRYILRDRKVRSIIAVKMTWGANGALTLFLTLLGMSPAFQIMGSPDLGVALLWTSRAIGTGVGPLIARLYAGEDEARLRKSIAAGFVVAVTCYLGIAFAPGPAVAVPLVFLAHLGGAVVWVMSTVLLQMTVPDELRGRTFAAEMGLVMLTSSLSHLVYGAVIDLLGFGLRTTMLLCAAVFAVAIATWIARGMRVPATDGEEPL